MKARLTERGGVFLQLGVQLAIAVPELVHEEEVDHASGFHEFGKRLAISGGELRCIVLEADGCETRTHLVELVQIRHNGSSGQQHHKRLHEKYCPTSSKQGQASYLPGARRARPRSLSVRSGTGAGASDM